MNERRKKKKWQKKEENVKGGLWSRKNEKFVALLTTNALMVAAVSWFEDWCSADVLKPPFIRASLGPTRYLDPSPMRCDGAIANRSLSSSVSFSLYLYLFSSFCFSLWEDGLACASQKFACTFEIHPFDSDRIDNTHIILTREFRW